MLKTLKKQEKYGIIMEVDKKKEVSKLWIKVKKCINIKP